ncbi:MAG: hypothetical protein J5680_05650 [Neisseriaceae bacterium]|nr:hypothetical protein [Neisseriaceae bacterium]
MPRLKKLLYRRRVGLLSHRQAAGLVVGWAFLPTITDKILSGCLKQYSAVILCFAVMVGWQAHPTALLYISGCLKQYSAVILCFAVMVG